MLSVSLLQISFNDEKRKEIKIERRGFKAISLHLSHPDRQCGGKRFLKK